MPFRTESCDRVLRVVVRWAPPGEREPRRYVAVLDPWNVISVSSLPADVDRVLAGSWNVASRSFEAVFRVFSGRHPAEMPLDDLVERITHAFEDHAAGARGT